jgi:hypothetical protein
MVFSNTLAKSLEVQNLGIPVVTVYMCTCQSYSAWEVVASTSASLCCICIGNTAHCSSILHRCAMPGFRFLQETYTAAMALQGQSWRRCWDTPLFFPTKLGCIPTSKLKRTAGWIWNAHTGNYYHGASSSNIVYLQIMWPGTYRR